MSIFAGGLAWASTADAATPYLQIAEQMLLLLHGTFGGWDEVVIAVAAFGVLWLAVKLAGRKPAHDGDADEEPGTERPVGPAEEESRPGRRR